MKEERLAVIGGGPAGMAAAVAAKASGVRKVILLERHDYLGGVLPQCIHNGFGIQIYEKDYTGGEYAALWRRQTMESGIEVKLGATVLSLEQSRCQDQQEPRNQNRRSWKISCVSRLHGAETLEADAVIVASGCRERTLPQLSIPGSRPAGIFTAGAAQMMMNRKNFMPGRTAVILGSGDIGLIMARRMALEGMKVKLVLGQKDTGLLRNRIQCVEDYGIPMRYGWTVVSTHGYQRLKGVSIAPFDETGKPDLSLKEYLPCDTLLVAAGLLPETAFCGSHVPGMEEGLFACGNVSRVHDLVDHVTAEGIDTGRKAAAYLLGHTAVLPESLQTLLAAKESTGTASEKTGNMVCTICPKGCVMNVKPCPFMIEGNQCPKGEDFARKELEDPRRVVTAVVAVTEGHTSPLVSVRTSLPVSREKVGAVMKALKRIHVAPPIAVGDIIAVNIAGTGVDLIATEDLE